MTEADRPEDTFEEPTDGTPGIDELTELVKKSGGRIGKAALPALGAAALAAFFIARSRRRGGGSTPAE